MNVSLWRIAADAPGCEARSLGGKEAERSGGRWNRRGRAIVYASTSIALACLETVVHLNAGTLPLNRVLVRIDVPEDVWADRRILGASDLPVGWSAIPEARVSLDIGDAWLRSGASALLVVPSVIVPEESNVLVNPEHPRASRLSAVKTRPWFYDGRLR